MYTQRSGGGGSPEIQLAPTSSLSDKLNRRSLIRFKRVLLLHPLSKEAAKSGLFKKETALANRNNSFMRQHLQECCKFGWYRGKEDLFSPFNP
ncbi:hypothetical protein SAMN05421736_10766 [Evansella caseinilytica]|uniref:Uncharacterized protein n=1 Tax=Evansella caseinilytica TaxID=1503961 RepID=A0A1H3QUL3_9BACI|nr:hypothetical protein [Evansella caseinilytica]SDZ17282.1 hypothetical protein SAMN05421736_10766 [Evansella caseinilytica]